MPLKREQFIRLLLHEVKFFPARARIREEYEAHFADAVERLRCQGKSEEEAEALAAERMGDPVELGRALNREHSPLIGWLLYLSRAALIVVGMGVWVFLLCVIIPSAALLVDPPENADQINAAQIVRRAEVDTWLTLDGERYYITDVVMTRENMLYCYYWQVKNPFLDGGQTLRFDCYADDEPDWGEGGGDNLLDSSPFWEYRRGRGDGISPEVDRVIFTVGANGRYETLEVELPLAEREVSP